MTGTDPITTTSSPAVKHLEENVAAAALQLSEDDLRELAGEDVA
jgi:hypothetical protein